MAVSYTHLGDDTTPEGEQVNIYGNHVGSWNFAATAYLNRWKVCLLYTSGSGYSIKNNTILDFGRYGMFALNMHLYQICTWKGYEHKDLETIDPLYQNAQGDKGNVMLAVVNPIIELNLSSHFKSNMEVSYSYRHTHYSYHEDIKYKTFETRLGLTYQF